MIERCFVKVEFDPATHGRQVGNAVGGFLRYIQHRDLHPGSLPAHPKREVAGLVKYVAYRDQASERAELFGPQGSLGTKGRKDFVGFVDRSLEGSQPQIFRTRSGQLMDRRRAVSRFLISPESAHGLDLERITRAAVSHLESEVGVSDLRWIAAIHRNTAHHHVHLVLAGMHEESQGGYRRIDITKPRLAAIKEAIGREIEHQRQERSRVMQRSVLLGSRSAVVAGLHSTGNPVELPAPIRFLRLRAPGNRLGGRGMRPRDRRWSRQARPLAALRRVALRYSRQMQREVDDEARRHGLELAA